MQAHSSSEHSFPEDKGAIAVYCASSTGRKEAYSKAAISLGHALARDNRPLVYGGGFLGIMGIVSGAVLENGGSVTGIVPYAIHNGGGEREKSAATPDTVGSRPVAGHERMETIVVNTMHERKLEMAKRSSGFIGLSGGFGTFEEILEVTTWTQLGIHKKPVVLLNVLSFFDPLRQLIQNGISEGFVNSSNANLIVFVDGPTSHEEHESFDWGTAALQAFQSWNGNNIEPMFDWTKGKDGRRFDEGSLGVV